MKIVSRALRVSVTAAAVAGFGVIGCSQLDRPTGSPAQTRLSQLPPVPVPPTNPITPAKVALGKQLFFDTRMSGSGKSSCESCHYRNLGWTDAQKLSKKDDGSMNTRHTPTLYNVGYLDSWYWDGRSSTLEIQTMAAWRGQTGADPAKVAALLSTVPGYVSQFQAVFNSPPTPDTIVQALATYIRTKNSGDSPWDRHEKGEKNAVSAAAKEGYDLFMGKGKCVICHSPPLYSNSQFYNIGLEANKEKKDLGRFNVTKAVEDTSAFKVPTLRSVAISGPYFHDGSVASLEEAVRYMANTHAADPNKTPILTNAGLSDAEIKKIVAFLGTLTSDEPLVRPTLP
jgi:cytochrome c peroxidase